ncbi:MAG: dynamin family protein [Ornithinimicrobium sp.]
MANQCSECGQANDASESFCSACGAFLEWAEQPHTEARAKTEVPADASPAKPALVQGTPQPPPSRGHDVAEGREFTDHRPPPSAPRVNAAISRGAHLATQHNRPDLAEQLNGTREALSKKSFTVVVVGEFKRGKSTLINALLQAAVCPVDADVVTAVPTIVRYGRRAGVVKRAMGSAGNDAEESAASLSEIAALVTDSGDSNPSQLRSVEISMPHRMLRSGMILVDTPGVGGLESVHGQLTLGALASADGVLFVTDASQELTGPELSFLKSTVDKCPRTAMVVTKTDLHAQWRRIVAINERHLRDAGLDLPVMAVSSFLRLRAATDAALTEEAGFEPLVRFLATEVVAPQMQRASVAAAADVIFVTDQLKHTAEAEQAVLARPEDTDEVVNKLTAERREMGALTAASATWQQTLADGVQDLVADVEHDLQGRLRSVLREVEGVIEEGDPKDAWHDTELWLRRQVAEVAVQNRDLLLSRADELASRVAADFDLIGDSDLTITGHDTRAAIADISLADSSVISSKPGRIGLAMVAVRSTAFMPMLVFGAAPVLGTFLLPVGLTAVVLSAGLGGKVVKDEAKRQRTHREQQAKAAARRFVDEVAFVMNKESRDGLRDTQRRLRDDFAARAAMLSRSSQTALDAVNRAAHLSPAERDARAEALSREAKQLDLVTLGVAGAAGVRQGA